MIPFLKSILDKHLPLQSKDGVDAFLRELSLSNYSCDQEIRTAALVSIKKMKLQQYFMDRVRIYNQIYKKKAPQSILKKVVEKENPKGNEKKKQTKNTVSKRETALQKLMEDLEKRKKRRKRIRIGSDMPSNKTNIDEAENANHSESKDNMSFKQIPPKTNMSDKTTINSKEKTQKTSNLSLDEIEKTYQGAMKEIRAIGEALIKNLDKHKHAIPIKNKKVPRRVSLAQPIASLACSGLLDSIEESYIGTWHSGEVLLIYAVDQKPEDKEKLEKDNLMFAPYYNAIMFGNLNDPMIVDGYIGFIRLGNKTIINKKVYIQISGAELLDEPSDDHLKNYTLCNTHVAKYKNITLENGVVKIPLSDIAWEMLINEEFVTFRWENKFEGFNICPEEYGYMFYTNKEQKYYKYITFPDHEEFDVERAVYQGKAEGTAALHLCFDLSKMEELPPNQSSFNILQKRSWILDWDCVNFKHRYIVVNPPMDGSVNFTPVAIQISGSFESFNYLKDYFKDRLSPIHCTVEKRTLTVDDPIRLNEAIQMFAKASTQKGISVSVQSTNVKITPTPISFNNALSKAKQMSLEEFKKYKSKHIDFLVSLQSPSYKIIPCVERLSHTNSDTTEYAFMFTIECPKNNILIVYENINPDRSTLLFLVKKDVYSTSIRGIYDFLQSAETNKRSNLREKNIDIKQSGIQHYRSINHDEFWTWKRNIQIYKHL